MFGFHHLYQHNTDDSYWFLGQVSSTGNLKKKKNSFRNSKGVDVLAIFGLPAQVVDL
jgi:hypothetical protein